MSKHRPSSETPMIENPSYVHLRVYDLEEEKYRDRGGVTLCYSTSEDHQWMRVGASFCSLVDNYAKNRHHHEYTDEDREWVRSLPFPGSAAFVDWEDAHRGHKMTRPTFACLVHDEAPSTHAAALAFKCWDQHDLYPLREQPSLIGREAAFENYTNPGISQVLLIHADWDNGRDWNCVVAMLGNDDAGRWWLKRALDRGLWDSWELRTKQRGRGKGRHVVQDLGILRGCPTLYAVILSPIAHLLKSFEFSERNGWQSALTLQDKGGRSFTFEPLPEEVLSDIVLRAVELWGNGMEFYHADTVERDGVILKSRWGKDALPAGTLPSDGNPSHPAHHHPYPDNGGCGEHTPENYQPPRTVSEIVERGHRALMSPIAHLVKDYEWVPRSQSDPALVLNGNDGRSFTYEPNPREHPSDIIQLAVADWLAADAIQSASVGDPESVPLC